MGCVILHACDIIAGESFILLKEDMKKVYAPYCRNHDDVLALLSRVSDNREPRAGLYSGKIQWRSH